MKTNIYYILIIVLILATFICHSQETLVDSCNKEFSSYAFKDTSSYISGDPLLIPSADLYNQSWDNENIKLRRFNPSEMTDSTIIFFNNSPENKFCFPCNCKLISNYGYRGNYFHTGVDLKLNRGDSIFSALPGKVRITRYIRGYGNVIVIRHYNGIETVYAHLSKIIVKVNQDVDACELIGYGGCSGRATTDHLHFEIRYLERSINPELILDLGNNCIKKDTLIITSNLFRSFKTNHNSSKESQTTIENDINENNSEDYHIVRRGDTLYNISRRYRISVDELCRINGISKTKILHIGNRLKIK